MGIQTPCASPPSLNALVKEDPPFSFWEGGQATGIAVDLMNHIAEETGKTVHYHRFDLNSDLEGLDLLKKNPFDVLIGGVVVDAESFPQGFFSRPYMVSRLAAMRLRPKAKMVEPLLSLAEHLKFYFVIMVFLFVVGLTIHYRRERSIGKNKEPNSFLWHFVVLGEWTLGVLSGRVFPCTNTEDHRERARYVFWSSYATFFKATVVGGIVSLFSVLSLTREAASPFVAVAVSFSNRSA
jgi:ABC-type amino acid transport substrate-binding protein